MFEEPAATHAADMDDDVPRVTIFRVPAARLPVLIALLGVVVGAGGICCILVGANGLAASGSRFWWVVALFAGIVLIVAAAVLSIVGVAMASHQPDHHLACTGTGTLHIVKVTPSNRRRILAAATEEPVLDPPPIVLSYVSDGGTHTADLRDDNAILSDDDRMWAYVWEVMVWRDAEDPLASVTFVTHPSLTGRSGRFIEVTSNDNDARCLIDPAMEGYSTLMTMIDDGC